MKNLRSLHQSGTATAADGCFVSAVASRLVSDRCQTLEHAKLNVCLCVCVREREKHLVTTTTGHLSSSTACTTGSFHRASGRQLR
jgi:hypothetical protein